MGLVALQVRNLEPADLDGIARYQSPLRIAQRYAVDANRVALAVVEHDVGRCLALPFDGEMAPRHFSAMPISGSPRHTSLNGGGGASKLRLIGDQRDGD